ncbi:MULTISPECIES: lipopolysaccharide biosynthesis protein [unclassified Flavobacterium]|uniref:lipopolysaccharide biosynthesis protein n=1 Tax=unclassified Flavobacterium TaxID=196869 RepID=UPI00360A014E
MSVVARQSLKYSIVGYFSTLIGILSTVFLYPNDLEFAGKIQYILPTALLALPLVTFGIMHANVRFYPKMEETNNQHNLLKYSIWFILRNFVIVTVLFWTLSYFSEQIRESQFYAFGAYIFPVMLCLALIQLFSRFISIKKRIVVPNIFENVFPKLGLILAFSAFFFFKIAATTAIWIVVLFFALALIGMFFYVQRLDRFTGKTSFAFLKENNFQKELMQYSFYTFFGSLGSIVALNIDAFMIGEFIGNKPLAIYNTSANLVRMITVPALGVYTISAPIIAKYIEENNMSDLKSLHHKTSLYLFTMGAVLFGLVASGIEDLFFLMKNGDELAQGLPVVYILGLALLFDLATGFNGYIITNSKYYKFNNTTTIALAVLTIVNNLIFLLIFKMGITGVAIATSISLTVYNLIKIGFNYRKFGVHPFSSKYLYVFGLLIVVLVVGKFLPDAPNKFLTLCYKPAIAFVIFALGNRIFNIIPIKEVLPKSLFK